MLEEEAPAVRASERDRAAHAAQGCGVRGVETLT